MPEGPPLVPMTLRGNTVHLEPLRPEHAVELQRAAAEAEQWRFMGMQAHTPETLAKWISLRIQEEQKGSALPFLIRDANTGDAVGSSSLFDYVRTHRRIEIGHTWLGSSHRGTRANPEAKRLLLGHAFETLRLVRVQLKTDPENVRSRRAILAIGAKEEGRLRNYITYADGTIHDRVFFSVLDSEWPLVKAHLEELIKKKPEPGKSR